MILTVKVLFCDEDHGIGEQTFPHIDDLDEGAFILPLSVKQLRRAAEAAGWRRRGGMDLCDRCVDAEKER
jgi:hypothetical protein